MNTDIMTAGSQPLTMSSREIAELCEARHNDVVATIVRLFSQGVLRESRKTTRTVAPGGGGRPTQVYDLTKRDTLVVVSGYNAELRAKIIDRWIELESRQPAAPALPDLSDPVVLVQLLTEHASKRIEAEHRADVAEQKVLEAEPKAAFYDAFMNAEGLYGLQNAARALNLRPNLFIRWLKTKYLFYQGTDLVPYVQYRQRELFDLKTEVVNDYKRLQSYITPKGLTYLNERVPDHLRLSKTGS